jgi:hypothetical protein
MKLRISQTAIAFAFAALTVFSCASAQAQTYTVSITSTAALGNVVSGASGDTEFDINPSTGAVTKTSGNGARLATGTTRAAVSVSCGNQNACNTTAVNIRVGTTGSPTNRARALNDLAIAMGTATLNSGPTGTNPISFQINAVGKSSNKTFYLGGDFPIAGDDSGLSTGAAASGFYVYVAGAPTTPTATISDTDTFTATAYKSLSLTKGSDLVFGRMVKPTSGSGTISVNQTTGARTVGAGVAISTPTPTRATYTVTGETGKVVAFTIPTSMTMTGSPSGSLAVTLVDTAPATTTLTTGSYSFGVGGSFTLSSATPSGGYSGTFNITVNYN